MVTAIINFVQDYAANKRLHVAVFILLTREIKVISIAPIVYAIGQHTS